MLVAQASTGQKWINLVMHAAQANQGDQSVLANSGVVLAKVSVGIGGTGSVRFGSKCRGIGASRQRYLGIGCAVASC